MNNLKCRKLKKKRRIMLLILSCSFVVIKRIVVIITIFMCSLSIIGTTIVMGSRVQLDHHSHPLLKTLSSLMINPSLEADMDALSSSKYVDHPHSELKVLADLLVWSKDASMKTSSDIKEHF
jgi:hypothetical protein